MVVGSRHTAALTPAATLAHLLLGLDWAGHAFGVSAKAGAAAGANSWVKVYDERPDVEDEDEGNGPLHGCGHVEILASGCDTKDNGQRNLDDNEGQLNPERRGQDAVLAVLDTKALVLPADENGREHVAANEEAEE